MRKKDKARRVHIEGLEPGYLIPPDNLNQINRLVQLRKNNSDELPTNVEPCSFWQIIFATNPSYYRIYSTVKQVLLSEHFSNQYNKNNLISNGQTNANLVNSLANIDCFIDDDQSKYGQYTKNIPKVISMGLNVMLDIIKDTYQYNPKICVRSLESLYNLFQALKPESLKNEPAHMIEKYFELIQSLIEVSYSSVDNSYENYNLQILELSLLSLISFSLARGDVGKILNCIKLLLVDCNIENNEYFKYQEQSKSFQIEIPGIVILFNKHVCSYLIERNSTPEWCDIGFPMGSLCETFQIQYDQNTLNNQSSKFQCNTSLTFDGQYLILYRCNRIFLIGSGYNETFPGQEINSSSITNFYQEDLLYKCCSGGWIGYINGEIFLQPNSNWSSNKIYNIDSKSLKLKNIVPLIADYSINGREENPFLKPTLCTTDGDCLILITLIHDDYITIRELKPMKLNLKMNCDSKEKISFSLNSEFTIRLSSVRFSVCGKSLHNLIIPSQNLLKSDIGQSETALKLIDINNLSEFTAINSIMTGKDFALMLTEQGKVFYTGNSHSLGIRHTNSYDKFLMLDIPKPVKIIQIAIGHEGNHALLLADDGTLFFVGSAKRGEDGDTSSRSNRFNKPIRLRKFTKIDSLFLNISHISCNHATSAIITKSGELYLFGKDSHHTNSNGLIMGLPKDFQVKSIALGKAHMLILSTKGLVVTSGFSNKGQCGFNHNNFQHFNPSQHYYQNSINEIKMNETICLDSRLDNNGHIFVFGKSRRCVRCLNCTENGSKCPPINIEETYCNCGNGNSGCINCGICSTCSETYSICVNNKNSDNSTKSLMNIKFGQMDFESDYDSSSKISSIPPTVLPLSQLNPIKDICTGLHHSVLLTEKGEVFTFGSNQFGQLGVGDFQNRFVPTRVKVERIVNGHITQISAGSNHTILLTSLGEVLTFGNNQNGQLGRSNYKLCNLNKYLWNTIPDRMDEIGPEFGRIAIKIQATGDFTFVKYDEILLSTNMFLQTKLIADKNNLMLIPPTQSSTNTLNVKNMDNDQTKNVKEKKCRHLFCAEKLATNNDNSLIKCSISFNNLNSNILIISRTNGICSILKQSKTFNDIDSKRINFDQYSSLFVDKFYQNLWAYSSCSDDISRFNLISIKMSTKINQIFQNRKNCSLPLPTSMFGNFSKFHFESTFNKDLKYLPSIVQPNMAMPVSDKCLMKKTMEQISLELLSSLSSFTYSYLLGLTFNEKLEQMNLIAKNILPEEYLAVCRFEQLGGGWGYPPQGVDAIRFSTDCDIILGGIGLYGGRGKNSVQIRLYDIGFDGGEIEHDGELLKETDIMHYECLHSEKYQIFFEEPLFVEANRWYVVWTSISGPSSDCGTYGQSFLCTSDQVMFHFKASKLCTNGTDVNGGQIPTLLYKQVRLNEFKYYINNNSKINSSLSVDEEGIVFSISKEFVLNINSQCFYSLCEILRFVWNSLKNNLLNPNRLEELFQCFDEDGLKDELDDLLLKIRKNLYIACFSLELIRAYVEIIFPSIAFDFDEQKSLSNNKNKESKKFLKYDYDEYKRIANVLYDICSLLTTVLMNPIQIQNYLEEKLSTINSGKQISQHQPSQLFHIRKMIRSRIIYLNKFQNFFLDECYRTYQYCCNAFYPTNLLKWSVFCDLLSTINLEIELKQSSSGEEMNNALFTNKQLYLLSAIAQRFCEQSIRLTSFFPVFSGSIEDSFINFDRTNLLNTDRGSNDIVSQIISKHISEFYPYNGYYLGNDFNCKFVYERFLNILIRPLRFYIEQFQSHRINTATTTMTTVSPSNLQSNSSTIINCQLIERNAQSSYKKFNNFNDNGLELSSSLSSSASTSSTESTSSSSLSMFEDECHISSDFTLNESQNFSSNISTFLNETTLSWDNTSTFNELLTDNSSIYQQKLIQTSCDLLLKFISEFNAYSLGLINTKVLHSKQNIFPIQNECCTPSRFGRRSLTKCWETGSGSPEAICFWVNKPGIYISGVRVYSSILFKFKYQLQLLDQAFDDNKTDKYDFKWKTIASVSGVYFHEDNAKNNKSNDVCDIRFEHPILIHPNIKYALLFKNHSQYSYSGDMGMAQVRGDDDTVFMFMDCSLSKNGTNLNRGQIPQILYFNIPFTNTNKDNENQALSNNSLFDNYLSKKSIITMFKMAIDIFQNILQSLIESINEKITEFNNLNSLSSSHSRQESLAESVRDTKILSLIYKIFDSIFIRQYLPLFIMHLKNLKFDHSLSKDLIISMSDLIPLISSLNQLIHSHFQQYGGCSLKDYKGTTHHITVESDHPYKFVSVTNYLVRFPKTVKFMTIEFDPKCCTSQPSDYLEIYIPKDNNFNITMNNSETKHCDISFHNLAPIYQRFSGKNFGKHLEQNKYLDCDPIKDSLNCIFIPGNEIVFVLKTSDYVHSDDIFSNDNDFYYGFKAEITGYEFQTKSSNISNCLTNKENVLCYINHMIQLFECDLVNLFGLCIDSLLNSSPIEVFQELMNKNSTTEQLCERFKSYAKYFNPDTDFILARQIFQEHSAILQKGYFQDYDLSLILNSKCLNDFFDSTPNKHSFLDDFIHLNAQSSGCRLAHWLQNVNFIMPNACLVNIVNYDSVNCCDQCFQFLLGNNFETKQQLCPRCHYQFFVKTLAQPKSSMPNCINTQVGKKIFIKIITRDQHEEIVYDKNAYLKLLLTHLSFSFNDSDILDKILKFSSHIDKSDILETILQNPYQLTIKDDIRYHSITMLKCFENYSFEELRLELYQLINKKAFNETISVQSFDNGYYLASWIPTNAGCYQVQLLIDGESSSNVYTINVNNDLIDKLPFSKSLANYSDDAKIKNIFDNNNQSKCLLSSSKQSVQPINDLKHSIRKFICSDSAGLRIRALPSLQSEQIGIVAVNGLLTVIDQIENDDGIWVRLSNESIQAYSHSTLLYHQETLNSKELLHFENFESNIINDLTSNDINSKQLRTEAWALQYNKHFSRTLLVSIDSENEITGDQINQDDQTNFLESLAVPGWFQVIHCVNGGQLIRNWPSLDESFVIGIISTNEIIYAVEIVQNEFGVWIRLSHESLHSHINTFYKSTLLDNNLEGWMLIRSINGIMYLRSIQNNYLNSTLVYNKELESNYINNNKYDEFSCFAVTKNAISNRAAKCIRAVFAAFVWHDGILNDVLTAASYLKFNAEITKDLINSSSAMNINNQHFNNKKKKSLENRRNQKVVFRHSVEVSQLMTIFQYSDVNSNVNFLEDNNNNENFAENDQQEEEIENQDELSGSMIPEILINLLQIWDFVSSGCLKLFDDHICLIKNNNITDKYCEINPPNENSLFHSIIQNIVSNKKNVSSEIMREHVKITNTEEFYDSILSSVNYLLSLVPSNEMIELSDNSNELLDRFSVKDNQYFSFQLLQHFDIKKSFYEEKLVEEKMTDLAISLQKTEDYQHLLSPDFYDNWRTVIERENDEVKNNCLTLSDNMKPNEKQKQMEKHKFHRSISVGMNEKLDSLLRPGSLSNLFKYLPLLSKNTKYVSKNNLTNASFDSQNNADSKFNMPFLCKPSIRLVNLIQKYQLNTGDKGNEVTNNELLPNLKFNDVFKFIFSCYNIDLYDLMTKSAICSAAYRTFALNVLNWLLLSVSNPLSVHEILWIFVYSLLPSQTILNDKISNVGEDEILENQTNKTLVHEQINKDVCRHPFYDLAIAGEMAERLITNSLHRFMKSISNLLSLLPMGSSLQKMAIRCFGIEFTSCDHIFLHECKVFSHISTILTRSSLDDCSFLYSNTIDFNDCQMLISKDITNQFEFKTSSRESMISSLTDNSTETFWESGQEDRTKTKNIIISKSFNVQHAFDNFEVKYFCIYVDNTKDNEYKITKISLKICPDNKDSVEKNSDFSNKYLASNDTIKVKTVDVNGKFFGWIQIEFSSEHNNELIYNDKYLHVELSGPFEYLRVRQIKILSCEKSSTEQNKLFNVLNYHQIQTSSCETETLRVFRLLTSQVFGKLLSNNLFNFESKRMSIYQNKNEIDLREHMVGILFSQYGKLTELQKQALLHIVNEIHLESTRVLDEWKTMMMLNDDNNNMNNNGELTLLNSKLINTESNDSYCFELLSLVLALSGSNVGQEYLSQQKELFYDILTLLHTSSDRVKRQVLSLVRRIIPNIHPLTFAKLFVQQMPNINDIFEKCHSEDRVSMGTLDIFLSCIAKSLTIQIKIKGVHVKRSPTTYTIHSALQHNTINEPGHNRYWLNGSISKQISQSIILLIKDMISGQFGKEWSEVARNSIFENIFKLTQLDENSRSPQECIQTSILWMAFASLCVLDENDTDMFHSSNFSKYYSQNSNSSLFYCDNHDDGKTIAFIQCNFCGRLCSDCDRFLHLNIKTRNHKRHIFKEELDSIKVDIHEGCGRVKFFWSLIVADAKQLKAMIEFKNNLRVFPITDDPELNSQILMENVCRFCGVIDPQIETFNGKNVCQNVDCQRYLEQVCRRTLNCGHICCGIANESPCLPCLNGCSKDLKQDGDDMCMICFSESLFSAPCIQLTCNHVFHYHCVQTVLEKRWSGGRITFTFSNCPICKIPIDHPSLVTFLDPIRLLFEDVQRKALLRLEFEGLNKCDAITCSDSRFYQNPAGFAMERYSYYLCFKCKKAYYGGEARCDAQFDENNFNPKELICGSCSDITQAGICSKHGTEFLEYKCRFCCSVAVYFCFGSTHFCNACHEDFQRLILLKEFPPCPVGPHGIPLDTEECPLHIVHPPTGQEFALGCAICRNTF